MSTIINARSPYYIKSEPSVSTPLLESSEVKLYIYNGVKGTDKPTTPTYTITKEPLDIPEGWNFMVLEVSELIRDFLVTEYYNSGYSVDAVWVEVDITHTLVGGTTETDNRDYLAFDGYGEFLEGAQPRESTDPTDSSYTPMVLQDNQIVYFVRDRDIKIPIFSEPNPTIVTTIGSGVWNEVDVYWEDADPTWDSVGTSQSVTDSDNTADKIQYLIVESTYATTGDTITITSTTGNSQTTVITLVEYCEPKFEKWRAIFYNKYGALQDIWFTKKSTQQLSVKDEKYKSNLMNFWSSSPMYGITRHTEKRFNVIAKQSISLNTDFVDESLNTVFEQMFMADQIWIENDSQVIPVVIKDKAFTRKTGVNDKVQIQYAVSFDMAYELIQNVR